MKICVAQARPVKGDFSKNIENHKRLISLALLENTKMIIFPELSISGYEPSLAKELATDKNDSRFDDFQVLSNDHEVTIGIGVPIKCNQGVHIGMVIFQPKQERVVYTKRFLHVSEEQYFIPGDDNPPLFGQEKDIAMAICYELSVPRHALKAFEDGAKTYIASVVEPIEYIEASLKKLSAIASNYSMTVLMSNCIGNTGGFNCPGQSAAWDREGTLQGQLNSSKEGVLVYDTLSKETVVSYL